MCITSLCSIGGWGPQDLIRVDYGKLTEAATKHVRSCLFSASQERTISCGRADVAGWDYLHKGDYSNHLIPVLWDICSVKLYISISQDNCVQTRLHQYHYSLHCFTQTTPVWLMNSQKTVYSRNSRKSITHAKEGRYIVNHTRSMGCMESVIQCG